MTSMTVVAHKKSIPQDTTLYLNGRKIIIKEHDGKIKKVKMYEAKADNDTIENTQVFEGVYLTAAALNEPQQRFSVPFVKKKKKAITALILTTLPSISALTNWQNNTFQYSLPKYLNLARNLGNGGINLFNTGVAITRNNHWGLTTTLGLARIVYKLDDNYGFEKVDGITVCRQAEDVDYQKSWLRYWAFRLPVSLEWQTKFGSRRAFIAAGPEVEWRVGVKSRAKYDDKKHTLSSKLNTHPLGMNLLLQAGYGLLGIQCPFRSHFSV